MRFIAIITVVAIIAVTVIIGLLIQRLKNRQSEELDNVRGRMTLAQDQLGVAKDTLRTICDLQGDSSFDAAMAIDKINQLNDDFYTKQKGLTR